MLQIDSQPERRRNRRLRREDLVAFSAIAGGALLSWLLVVVRTQSL